ncbi:MAG TPA: serine/threonine-protein kinase [Acidobacteriaceae bacterium]|nr:serine/threonine-protein kinase [Acidobacteriaceae bacterium]
MIAPNLTLRPGDKLDGYELEDVVATSGMATVFRARDLKSGLQVAIKVPHPEVESDPTMFDRFRREEEIGTRIDHPGVMKVFANPERTQVYMVMEWLDGRLLRQMLNEEKKLPVERAVKLMIGICDALDYVHANGVAHRDLKPENIMVGDDDEIHLIDFGIAASAGARRLTFAHFSQSMGTPDYISPEQVRGKRGDARSDIYALGVMLYEMLTGVVPFSGPNPFAVMNDRLLNQPVPPRELEPSISPQLQEIVYRAMEREPKNRYASAREMAHDLRHQEEVGVAARPDAERWRTRRSPERRRILLYAGLALIPVLLFGLLLLVSRHH